MTVAYLDRTTREALKQAVDRRVRQLVFETSQARDGSCVACGIPFGDGYTGDCPNCKQRKRNQSETRKAMQREYDARRRERALERQRAKRAEEQARRDDDRERLHSFDASGLCMVCGVRR